MDALKQATVQTNIEWFRANENYMAGQSQLECYRHIRKIVERELRGVGDLLDVGNGGFFNYDTGLVGRAAEACGFQVEEFTFVPRGWFLLQCGYCWPSLLTPARPIKLVLRREDGRAAAVA